MKMDLFLARHLGQNFLLEAFGSKFSLQTFWSKFPLQAFGSGTPFFGVNLAVEKEGQIREGDTVFAPAT